MIYLKNYIWFYLSSVNISPSTIGIRLMFGMGQEVCMKEIFVHVWNLNFRIASP